jgi:hypothetical protein
VERKRSLIVAAVVSGTLLAASTTYALTAGLLDRPADDGAGTLAPVTATLDKPTDTTTAPVVERSDAPAAQIHRDTGDDDDERLEREGHGDDTAPRRGSEYEGADDDD